MMEGLRADHGETIDGDKGQYDESRAYDVGDDQRFAAPKRREQRDVVAPHLRECVNDHQHREQGGTSQEETAHADHYEPEFYLYQRIGRPRGIYDSPRPIPQRALTLQPVQHPCHAPQPSLSVGCRNRIP